MAEQLLTRYYIYESITVKALTGDAAAADDIPGGRVLHLVGEELARSSRDALAAHFGRPPERDGTYVAISENARRLRNVKTTVRAQITEVTDEPQVTLDGNGLGNAQEALLSDPTGAV